MLSLHLTPDLGHLLHVEFTRQDHDIGKLRIEAQGLDVRDVQLCGEVYLLSHPVAIGHHSYVAGNHSRDTSLFGGIDDLAHQWDVLAIDNRVHRQIALDAMLIAGGGDLLQVVDGERGSGMRPHVQFLNTEVNAVGTSLNGCCQRFARAHRGHNLVILDIFAHCGCKITK